MKKALVTGGAGYIGSHLCEELLNNGYQVTAYDNLIIGNRGNFTDFKNNKNFNFIKGDVLSYRKLASEIKKVDIVYHLAAVVGVSEVVKRPLANIDVNLNGVMNVARAAHEHGNIKVVFTSSSEVYGKNDEFPLTEDTTDSIFGSTKINRWAYGMAKALGEQILLAYKDKGLPIAIVRYFNSYGERGINSSYANVTPKFIMQALRGQDITVYGDGSDTRAFCYVKDTVRGTILAGEKLEGDIVNIGNNHEITILKLAETIIKLTNSKSKIKFVPKEKVFKQKFDGAKRRVPNVNKAMSLIGFEAKTSLEEGLRKTIDWTKTQI